MKKGDVVFNQWHGIRRYGVVQRVWTEKESACYVPWAYAKVKWFSDSAYETVIEQTNNLRNDGSNIVLEEYRVDKLTKINLDKELKTLKEIENFRELEL